MGESVARGLVVPWLGRPVDGAPPGRQSVASAFGCVLLVTRRMARGRDDHAPERDEGDASGEG